MRREEADQRQRMFMEQSLGASLNLCGINRNTKRYGTDTVYLALNQFVLTVRVSESAFNKGLVNFYFFPIRPVKRHERSHEMTREFIQSQTENSVIH